VIDSILFYAGLATGFAGALSLLFAKSRRRGAALLLAGSGAAAVALLLPVQNQQIEKRTTYLDDAMPRWQFDERHTITVDAPPERVFAAIHAVTPGEIRFFIALTTIRRGFRPAPQNILNAPPSEPLLDLATRTSFVYLHDEAPREIVVGTEIRRGKVYATMNFLITPIAEKRCVVSTETRVFAKSPEDARRFAIYWRIIHPGSDIIRRSWLRAIKRRSEAS
jgi:hypothetical protein